MPAKDLRQKALLKLIADKKISGQEELLAELRALGYSVTQATVSRDIKELSIVKLPDPEGGYRYQLPGKIRESGKTPEELLREIFPHAVSEMNFAQNIVVIKCLSGMAQAVCEHLDNARYNLVVGTIAGDNTIFVVLKSEQAAIELVNRLSKYY